MRTRVFASFILVAILSSGCTQKTELPHNNEIDDIFKDGYRTEILQAIVMDEFPFTRLTQTTDGAPRIFENSDNIAVLVQNTTNNEIRYIRGQSLGTGKFRIEIPNNFTRDYYSIYPYAWRDINNYGDPDLKVTLPTEYDYEQVKDQKLSIGMVAINDPDNSTLEFYPFCGCLRLTVTGVPAGTGVISVAFDKCITGSFLVEEPWDFYPFIQLDATTTPEQVLIFFDDKTAADGSYTVNIPMPVGTYATIAGKACDIDDVTWEPSTELATGNATFPANAIPTFTGTVQRGKLYEFTLNLSAVSSSPIGGVTTNPMDVVDIDLSSGNYGSTWN